MPEPPSPPSQSGVDAAVIGILADLTGIAADKISSSYMSIALSDPPLSLDDVGLRHLALALQTYVRQQNPTATVVIGDVSGDGETVRNLCDLIYKRIVG